MAPAGTGLAYDLTNEFSKGVLMHSIHLSSCDGSHPWLVPDGIMWLPAGVAGAAAVVLIADRGLLIRRSRLTALRPGHDGLVRWRYEPSKRVHLDLDPTRGDAIAANPALEMYLDDGTPIHLGDGITLIGRHRCCHVALDDDRISAFHCALRHTAGGVRVVDLDSSNGTYVDGTRVQAATVNRRATIRIADRRLIVAPLAPDHGTGLVELRSAAMRAVDELITRVAPADAPVFIHGASGTGKERVARELHLRSGRSGSFVVLNAAVLRPELAASELFGHVAGAFTGARSDRRGAFLAADGGTLFIDEIADLRIDVQAELLRVIEAKQIRPVGSTRAVPVDVRLVTATHRDLADRVHRGAFREDLFHRIWVLPIRLQPLRERLDDLDAIADDFVARQSPRRALSPGARKRLHEHKWPGNIRELLNVLRRAVMLRDAEIIDENHLDIAKVGHEPAQLDDVIRHSVINAYQKHGCSVAATARELGVHRSTVYRHLKHLRAERIHRK